MTQCNYLTTQRSLGSERVGWHSPRTDDSPRESPRTGGKAPLSQPQCFHEQVGWGLKASTLPIAPTGSPGQTVCCLTQPYYFLLPTVLLTSRRVFPSLNRVIIQFSRGAYFPLSASSLCKTWNSQCFSLNPALGKPTINWTFSLRIAPKCFHCFCPVWGQWLTLAILSPMPLFTLRPEQRFSSYPKQGGAIHFLRWNKCSQQLGLPGSRQAK